MIKNFFNPFPVLHTEKLILRQLAISDDEEIFALRSDKRVNKYLDRQPANSIEDAENFINKISESIKRNESIYWAITLRSNKKLAGTICYFNFSDKNSKAEIGYELLPEYHGMGIMQEAIYKVLEFGVENLKLNRIEAYTYKDNKSSTKLLEKHGFKRQSLTEKEDNDKFVCYLYNLSKKDL